MTNIDFRNINRAAIGALHPILARLLPSGRPIAGEYVALNPTRSDRRPGSFKIKLTGPRVGCWCDFATGDKGGDVISLVAYVEGIAQGESARMIARMLGLETGGPRYG
jgi:putative DNA primase/helicase